MELFLQTGHGMKAHCLELISKWGGGTAILSPKNMTRNDMLSLSKKMTELKGSVIMDPQFYVPRAVREKLQKHPYWPQDYDTHSFFSGEGIKKLITDLLSLYIEPMQASAFIVPTLMLMNEADETWDKITEITINEIEKRTLSIPKYCTLCVGGNLLKDQNRIHDLLERIEQYPVDGFYIIPVHPQDSYLVEDVSWLINLMDLCAGIKILGKKVILGYSAHQLLLLALTKVDAICAGTWLKTRMFPLGDFSDSDDQKRGNHSAWYYCPQALTEYQIGFLDIAFQLGILSNLKTPKNFGSSYADIIFSGAQPSTVDFSEREAFRHYLHCLKIQCNEATKNTYDDTLKYLKILFETALEITSFCRSKGIRGKHRDFSDVAETNISLLDAFNSLRGLIYRHKWDSL